MKCIVMVVLMVMAMVGIAEAYPWNGTRYSYPGPGGYHPWNGITGVRHPWDYYSPQVLYGYGGGYGVGYGWSVGYPNAKVNITHSWGHQGGQYSYQQSPDYLGMMINSGTHIAMAAIIHR